MLYIVLAFSKVKEQADQFACVAVEGPQLVEKDAICSDSANPMQSRRIFWEFWSRWDEYYSQQPNDACPILVVDHIWPTVSRFLDACMSDDPTRHQIAPFPVYQLDSMLRSRRLNTTDLRSRPYKAETPLNEARFLASVLKEVL